MMSGTINGNWKSFDKNGYQADAAPVTVIQNDDGTVTIGRGLHRNDELEIEADESGRANRIEHRYGGWYLTR